MEFIDLRKQYKKYQPEIQLRMNNVLEHGRFIMGPEIAELELKLAEHVGVQHCLTVASGTVSLEIALRALGIGPGDEVITVPFTWISSAEVIALVGATPVFVDIRAEDFNMDVDQLEHAITPRTKAIMPVSLFGQMPDYDRINKIADKYGITVIEDGAQSFGATQRGKRSCGVTRVASTSFFPAKPLGCYGDGGALFTSDDALAEKMRAIRTHGGSKRHHHPYVGLNGRFDTIQAAVILAKFPHYSWEVEQRARIGAKYTELFMEIVQGSDAGGQRSEGPDDQLFSSPAPQRLSSPKVMPGNTHVYAQYTIRVNDRNELGERLKSAGVPTAVYYPKCLHEQPVFAQLGYKWGDFPVAEKVSRDVISLPMHPFLEEADQERIVGIVARELRS